MPRIGLVFMLSATLLGSAQAASLAALLAAVDRNARAPEAVRADLRFTRGDKTSSGVLLGWRDTWYLETEGGFRALVRHGKQVILKDGHALRAPIRTQVPGTDLLLEELPFEGAPLSFPQIADEAPDGTVVSGAPAGPSLYVLVVHTVDTSRAVVMESKYYKDDIASLMKLRRDTEFAAVARHVRPQRIEVEDYVEKSTTRVTLAWRPHPESPRRLFLPSALRQPSGVMLPTGS